MNDIQDQEAIQREIESLETRLQHARLKLSQCSRPSSPPGVAHGFLHSLPTNHITLLLSDSALPLGSFAFSSGLESYLAHLKLQQASTSSKIAIVPAFHQFLDLSLASLASTTLPYVLAAHRDPSKILRLDNDYDASIPCTVARRASIAQGKALLALWERSFAPARESSTKHPLDEFKTQLKAVTSSPGSLGPNAHFPVIWGALTFSLSVTIYQSGYVFLLNHVKALLSAAVRASVMGPYQSQAILASPAVRDAVTKAVEKGWNIQTEDAGQVAPVIDLWVGRHEMLYSRIFNS